MLLFVVVYDASSNLGTPSFTNQAKVRHIGKIRRKRQKAINKSVYSRLQPHAARRMTAHAYEVTAHKYKRFVCSNRMYPHVSTRAQTISGFKNYEVVDLQPQWIQTIYQCVTNVFQWIQYVAAHMYGVRARGHFVRARGLQAAMFVYHR